MKNRKYTKATGKPLTWRQMLRKLWVELAFGVAAVGAAALLVRPLL
jgi:hypothetical protein